ncbi:SDR family NAD(P)-dependent oxidoreductase [Cupriavidus necator]
MESFRDKVAVITGGASGFGKAFARTGAALGMKLVLADIDEHALGM